MDTPQFVADVLNCRIHVTFKIECDVGARATLARIRAQLIYAVNRVDVFLNFFCQRAFGFLRTDAGEQDLDIDCGLVGLRHQIDAKSSIGKNSQGYKGQGHHDCENRPLDADVGNLH